MLEFTALKQLISNGLESLDKTNLLLQCKKRFPHDQIIYKGIEPAEKAKAKGNSLYSDLIGNDSPLHHQILHLYNECIAYAPINSEHLATAYANKSALLKRMRRYPECISEIDKSFKISKCIPLKIKLLCRKSECLTALGSCDNSQYLEKARFFFSKLTDEDEKMTKMLKSLIKKTQQVLDEGKLEIPKVNRRKLEASEEIAEAEKRSIWSCVNVEFSEKYGRHLIAKRDFKPGEILYVEKPYCSLFDDHRIYQYCFHCLNYLYTIVPCDHCPWRTYCSQECKDEAWNECHRMECSVLCKLKATVSLEVLNTPLVSFLITIFFKALGEAGSVDQMQDELKSVDECQDPLRRGFSNEGEFSSYKSLYSLPMRNYSEHLKYNTMITSLALVFIAKCTKVFERSYDFKETKMLRKNNTAIFVGAFLLRTSLVIKDYCTSCKLYDPSVQHMQSDEATTENSDDSPRAEKLIFSDGNLVLTTCMTVAGCIPNVERCIMYGKKYILYALQPIKSGSQLIFSMRLSSVYDNAPQSIRQSIHKSLYNCHCNCEACVNEWSKILNDSQNFQGEWIPDDSYSCSEECIDEVLHLVYEWRNNYHKQNYPGLKQMSRIRNAVLKNWTLIPMPSFVVSYTVGFLITMSTAFYNPSEVYAKDMGLALKQAL